jgi:hypothetical protein
MVIIPAMARRGPNSRDHCRTTLCRAQNDPSPAIFDAMVPSDATPAAARALRFMADVIEGRGVTLDNGCIDAVPKKELRNIDA